MQYYVVTFEQEDCFPEICYDRRTPFVTDSLEEAKQHKYDLECNARWMGMEKPYKFVIKKLVDL